MNEQHVIHLHNRFGFGISEKKLQEIGSLNFRQIIEQEPLHTEEMKFGGFEDLRPGKLDESKRREVQKKSREWMQKMNISWLRRMVESPTPFREKINLFWHHHFACEIKNPVFAQLYTNALKKHSLGNFKDLLLAVSQSAAMINYLNLRQNRKQNPNEDFARELCELFTLGVDHDYNEEDIKEIARTFTGWNHNSKGKFNFRKKAHDSGVKHIFGQSGNFDGNDVVDLIIEKKACAQFIASNVYTYFVSDQVNQAHINELSDVLYGANYDLMTLFQHLSEASWFYADDIIMSRIKSPIELIVGMGRIFQMVIDEESPWISLQRAMDQILYRPPNVAGWSVGKEWINSNSLSLRLRLPSLILAKSKIDYTMKPELDAGETMMSRQKKKGLQALGEIDCNWEYFYHNYPSKNYIKFLLNNRISDQAKANYPKSGRNLKQREVIYLLSLPEYQLC